MPKKWLPNCDNLGCYNLLRSLYIKNPNYKSMGDKYYCTRCDDIFLYVEAEKGKEFTISGYSSTWYFMVKADFDQEKRMEELKVEIVDKD